MLLVSLVERKERSMRLQLWLALAGLRNAMAFSRLRGSGPIIPILLCSHRLKMKYFMAI